MEMWIPKHLVALSDADLAILTKALEESGSKWGDPLLDKLTILPLVHDGKLSERGRSAALRLADGVPIRDEVEGAAQLREARDEFAVTDAYREISLLRGKPGRIRGALVEDHREAMDALHDAAVLYIDNLIEHETR